jgi:hypothetical protein
MNGTRKDIGSFYLSSFRGKFKVENKRLQTQTREHGSPLKLRNVVTFTSHLYSLGISDWSLELRNLSSS